jgi:hypothetical protein
VALGSPSPAPTVAPSPSPSPIPSPTPTPTPIPVGANITIDIAAGGLVSGAGTISGDGGGNNTVALASIDLKLPGDHLSALARQEAGCR